MSYICELMFDAPDHDRPQLSHHEVDYYQWSPASADLKSHRLSMRKNLSTGLFEVYRRFMEQRTFAVAGGQMLVSGSTQEDTGLEEVAFRGGFVEALGFAGREAKRVHGSDPEDEPCQHERGRKSFLCGAQAKKERK